MAKRSQNTGSINNKRARHDYALLDTIVVGLELTGAETKALRRGQGSLQGAHVTVKDGELWLINSRISGNNGLPIDEQEQTRSRKLLAKRREIDQLIASKQQGKTIVPLSILTKGRYVKLRIASARGKKQYDKRAVLKKREEDRSIGRALKAR